MQAIVAWTKVGIGVPLSWGYVASGAGCRVVVVLCPCKLLLSEHWLLSGGFVAGPVLPSGVLCYDGPTYPMQCPHPNLAFKTLASAIHWTSVGLLCTCRLREITLKNASFKKNPMQCPIAFGWSRLTSTFDWISLNVSGSRLALVDAASIVRATHQGSNPIQFCADFLPLWLNGIVAAVLGPVDSVPCWWSHFCNLAKLAVHCCHVPGAGHCVMCCLSLRSALHLGQCADDCCPWHCMFFPCENCPVICFVTHLLLCAGILLIALSTASISNSDKEVIGWAFFVPVLLH